MSYRELRNFTEAMRALGYTRLISVENFRTPNFELVSDILQWLTQRYDPSIDIPKEKATESDRVVFLKTIASAIHDKAQIKLNTKKLYSSDGYAVQELLKLATLLHAATKESTTARAQQEETEPVAMTLSGEERQIRALGVEVTGLGSTIHDLLSHEPELRDARLKAITRLLDSDDVEREIKRTINSINTQMKQMADNLENLAADESNLETKIERKRTDLERSQTRLKSLQAVRPAFMDEYEKLEVELKKLYNIYLERFRNVEYLENELETYNREESEKLKESEKLLKHMQSRIREEEMTMLREGKASSLGHRHDSLDDSDEEQEEEPQERSNGRGATRGGGAVQRGNEREKEREKGRENGGERGRGGGMNGANGRGAAAVGGGRGGMMNGANGKGGANGGGRVRGSMAAGDESESEEGEDMLEGGDEDDGSSPDVSLDSDHDDDDFDDNEF